MVIVNKALRIGLIPHLPTLPGQSAILVVMRLNPQERVCLIYFHKFTFVHFGGWRDQRPRLDQSRIVYHFCLGRLEIHKTKLVATLQSLILTHCAYQTIQNATYAGPFLTGVLFAVGAKQRYIQGNN